MPEMTLQQAFDLAIQHHQTGRLNEAESLYRQILAVEPQHADSLHHLGLIAHQMGRSENAVDLIRQAISLQPDNPVIHSNLGKALIEMGQLDDAIAACRQTIHLQPNFPVAHYNLGLALHDKGQLDEAIAAYREAIAFQPDLLEVYGNLGVALHEKGRLEEAIVVYRQALALRSNNPEVLRNLGNALGEKGQHDEAIDVLLHALSLSPDYPAAHNDLGTALRKNGQLDESIAAYHSAISLQPDLAEAHNNLGLALSDKGEIDRAICAYHQAIALRADYLPAYNNLGSALSQKGQLDEAIAAFRQALALQPDLPEAHCNLGGAMMNKGQLDEAIAAWRRALALKPDDPHSHSNLLLCMNYHSGLEASSIAEEHRQWKIQHAEPLRSSILPLINDRSPSRRLRVGYVSPDFRDHSVAYFLEGLLERHDPSAVEVLCYSDVPNPDAVTARMEQLAGYWRRITGLPDAEVAGLIRSDGIDILVDLAGHTANHRLPVFARKPAPVQVTWLGYPNTTGLDTIDYRLTDAFADLPGSTEHLHTEQLVWLPRSAWCYRPSEHSPPVSATPVNETGRITFGCFNAMPKINDALLAVWVKILLSVPDSRLLLKNKALAASSVRQHVTSVFQDAGIDPDRIEMVGQIPELAGHLASYGRVDIALDTFPYHGTTTTCEALWMGVPVVTLAGQSHVSRVGVSLLSNLDHLEWIASNPEEYVDLAVALANDLPHLAALRSSLRERMQASALMDAAAFARDMEAAYRNMWHNWCEKPESQRCPK